MISCDIIDTSIDVSIDVSMDVSKSVITHRYAKNRPKIE